MGKLFLSKIGNKNPKSIPPEDQPMVGTSAYLESIDALELEKLRIKDKQDQRDHDESLEKLRTGKRILFWCAILWLLLYIVEVLFIIFDLLMAPEMRILFLESVRFISVATVGYIFATKEKTKTK